MLQGEELQITRVEFLFQLQLI